jgi:GT2 family glycosyltransferase
VLDNDSRDGTPECVASEAPWARLVRTGANLGYAKAVNRGITETSGALVLVLNPDCVWPPGAIHALAAWLASHPRCGIAAPRILNPDGTVEYSARAYPDSFTFLFNRYSLLTRLWPGNPWSRRYLLLDWDHASPRSVDWVSGAAMLVRRAAIDAVGGMDEAFFMFNEDVDWCRRMNDAGWSVDYVPDATVVHHIGASKGDVSNRVILERHRGMIHYFRKHHRRAAPVDWIAAFLIMARARMLVLLNRLGR